MPGPKTRSKIGTKPVVHKPKTKVNHKSTGKAA